MWFCMCLCKESSAFYRRSDGLCKGCGAFIADVVVYVRNYVVVYIGYVVVYVRNYVVVYVGDVVVYVRYYVVVYVGDVLVYVR